MPATTRVSDETVRRAADAAARLMSDGLPLTATGLARALEISRQAAAEAMRRAGLEVPARGRPRSSGRTKDPRLHRSREARAVYAEYLSARRHGRAVRRTLDAEALAEWCACSYGREPHGWHYRGAGARPADCPAWVPYRRPGLGMTGGARPQ